jgi:hypothetical protein
MCVDLELRCWSVPRDHARIGTPALMLSRVEFQPQWLRKPPVAGWFRIFLCGTHPFLVPLLCPQNLVHVTRVLRLGLGFWSFVDWEVMLALPAGRESDGLRKGWQAASC